MRTGVPLIMKDFLNQISLAHDWHSAHKHNQDTDGPVPPMSIGYMIFIAITMWMVLSVASSILYHNNWRSKLGGKLVGSAVTTMISRKAMRLSNKSRVQMTDGKITTMVSVDTAFIDSAVDQSTEIICTPAQVIASVALLYWQLGYSAFVGLGVIFLAVPLKVVMFKYISKLRKSQNQVIDERVRLLSEALGNIKAIKLYAYEAYFSDKISDMRKEELKKFKSSNLTKSVLSAMMGFLPTLAAISTFITYASLGHKLDAAVIFSSLQYFNNIKNPIAALPDVLNTLSQVSVGISRVGSLLKAEEIRENLIIDKNAEYAVDVKGDFQFEDSNTDTESAGPPAGLVDNVWKGLRDLSFWRRRIKLDYTPVQQEYAQAEQGKPFSLVDIDLRIPRGSLVCVVGRVGAGKSALVYGLLNEMKQVKGHVRFGGSVGYVPQQAWLQSGTIRENITFYADNAEVNEERLQKAIDASGLRRDIDMWPSKELTEVGSKGITLSGGQRQRICIARAAYQDSDIVLLDDPLSAVDPHVAQHSMDHCMLGGPLADRTRIMVTHKLDILPYADTVVVMDISTDGIGKIVQTGTFSDLIAQEASFRSHFEQCRQALENEHSDVESTQNAINSTESSKNSDDKQGMQQITRLIVDEEKPEGDIAGKTYRKYVKFIGSFAIVICFSILLILAQVASVLNTVLLGYWSEDRLKSFVQGEYMRIYAGLGVCMATFTCGAIYAMFLAGIKASYNMFNQAWHGVIRSPTSWHDRTPTGRILNRLSKDVEILDDKIASTWYNVFSGALTIVGSIGLVLYTYPLAGVIFIPILYYDWITVRFYRRISRDINKLVSVLRSQIYTNLGEQLSGLAVIRAFKKENLFQRRLEGSINTHLSAIMISGFTQGFHVTFVNSWLGHRVGFVSILSVLVVSMCGIIWRETVSAAKLGVVLSYVMLSTSTLTRLVGSVTEAILLMNTVERVQNYTELPPEAASILPDDPPLSDWPNEGKIEFSNVSMKYRPELPLALKKLNFSIEKGEKIGIIGRTGSGKSSLIQALFRLVEITDRRYTVEDNGSGGKIMIDEIDISTLGLSTLRERISIIPQDPFLFSGTIRENIDPTGQYTDAKLNDSLNLIIRNSKVSLTLKQKLKLDYVVVNEGTNFSVGERQLITLLRALATESKILVLDEATSSVDLETDTLIQEIIQNEFPYTPILSIAHRISTIKNYDKILVLDQGELVEYDTPENLYNKPGSTFRRLCDKSNLVRKDVI
ncbi:uncharacterized protein L201_007890 [Kwoniella dendrophila CBS 6074]|uniref:P-loop containing nucleoside triphosphate hydrolase protein n=1 Tax=Kwoniella dendrophila CBS 6074 TaxID=1295534 RepID=A0AAX4K5J6_9TREE